MTSMPLNPKKQVFKFWVYNLNKTSHVIHVDTSVDAFSNISLLLMCVSVKQAELLLWSNM